MAGNTGWESSRAACHASPLSSDLRGEICLEPRHDTTRIRQGESPNRDGAVSSELVCRAPRPWFSSFSELVLAESRGQLHNFKILAKDAKELKFFENVQQHWRWEGIVELARLPDRIHLLCWMRTNADPLWGWQGIKGSQEGGNYDGTPSNLVRVAMKETKEGK